MYHIPLWFRVYYAVSAGNTEVPLGAWDRPEQHQSTTNRLDLPDQSKIHLELLLLMLLLMVRRILVCQDTRTPSVSPIPKQCDDPWH